MTTDYPSSLNDHSMIKTVDYHMAQAAALQVYEKAGIGPGGSAQRLREPVGELPGRAFRTCRGGFHHGCPGLRGIDL